MWEPFGDERRGHYGATSSYHWSWHPWQQVKGIKSYLTLPGGSRSYGQTVLLWMSLCWCNSVDVTLFMSTMNITLLMSLYLLDKVSKLISLYWYHSENFTLLMSLFDVFLVVSLFWCQFVDVTLLTIRYVNEQQL